MLYIHHATLMAPDVEIEESALLAEGDRITAVGKSGDFPAPAGAQVLDASGLVLAPGLIDLQLNGGFGLDFTATPEGIWQVAARLPEFGVTAFLPTIVTSPPDAIAAARRVLANGAPADFQGAHPLGLHLEGPFLNPTKRGAHNPAHLRLPDRNAINEWSPGEGVRLVTLAPELPGALELVRILVGREVVVSAGHSMATYEEARAGLDAGIRYGTHLFNAMPPLDHRAPGLAGALLTDSRAVVGIIPDGVHVHSAIVDMAWRSKGVKQLSVVTDAMAALAMAPGRYQLGDFRVIVDEGSARLENGTLAGSILSLDQAVRNLCAFTGCSLAQALASVTILPATLLGLGDRGKIAPGKIADLVLLTKEGRVVTTIVGGKIVWKSSP